MYHKLRVLISGGGTGGHIFPAISIANEIMAKYPDAVIEFVGASGRMEMEKFQQQDIRFMDFGFQVFKEAGVYRTLCSHLR